MFLQINLNKLCFNYILPFLKKPHATVTPDYWELILSTYKEKKFSFFPSYQERRGQFQDKVGGLLQMVSYSLKVLAVKLFCCEVLEVGDLEWPNYTVFLSVFQMCLTRSCKKLVIESWVNMVLYFLWPLTCNYLLIQHLQSYHSFYWTHNRKIDTVKISYMRKSQKWETSWPSSSQNHQI